MARIVIGMTVVLVVLIISGVAIYYRRKKSRELSLQHGWAVSGDMNAEQEHQILQLNSEAATLIAGMLNQPPDIAWNPSELTVIGATQRNSAEAWLLNNAKVTSQYRRKGIAQ